MSHSLWPLADKQLSTDVRALGCSPASREAGSVSSVHFCFELVTARSVYCKNGKTTVKASRGFTPRSTADLFRLLSLFCAGIAQPLHVTGPSNFPAHPARGPGGTLHPKGAALGSESTSLCYQAPYVSPTGRGTHCVWEDLAEGPRVYETAHRTRAHASWKLEV